VDAVECHGGYGGDVLRKATTELQSDPNPRWVHELGDGRIALAQDEEHQRGLDRQSRLSA
jgi:hypothetical protein